MTSEKAWKPFMRRGDECKRAFDISRHGDIMFAENNVFMSNARTHGFSYQQSQAFKLVS